MVNYFVSNDADFVINNCFIAIDYKDISGSEIIKEKYSNFHELLQSNPENVIGCIGKLKSQ